MFAKNKLADRGQGVVVSIKAFEVLFESFDEEKSDFQRYETAVTVDFKRLVNGTGHLVERLN